MAGIIEGIVAWTLSLIQAYGPYSIFLAVLLEEILVPIPSALVVMAAGFLLIPAGIPLIDAVTQVIIVVVIPASIASTIGSFFIYGIGYYGGRRLITRMRGFLGISWEQIKENEKKFGENKWKAITILRAIPFFPLALTSVTAGVLRLDWKKYGIATFIGSVPRTFILGFAGWYFGSAYTSIAENLNAAENIILVVAVIAIIYVLYRIRRRMASLTDKMIVDKVIS